MYPPNNGMLKCGRIIRIQTKMIDKSCINGLIFLIFTYGVNTECPSYPSLRCCPDSVWDDEQNSCVGCPAGFQGPNCALSCDPPYYGKECQLKCACKGGKTCHPSFGCILPTSTTTTIEITTKISTTEDETRTAEADVAKFGSSATTKTANKAVGVTLPTSTGNWKFLEKRDSQNDTVTVKNTMLGIFVLCGLFIVLFAVFVGAQIRSKCFNKNTPQSTTGVNLNSYDVINADQPPGVDDMSQAEDAMTQDRTLPKYVEIVGSPKNSTQDPGNEFLTMSERTYSKQLYLSAV